MPQSQSQNGGVAKAYRPTGRKVMLPGKTRISIVYEGPRGGKYVKMNGRLVSLSKAKH